MQVRHWFDFLFPPRADELVLRHVSPDEFLALMAPRIVPETRPETVALLPFTLAPVRSAIHEAKYHGSGRAFGFLGAALAEYLLDGDDGFRKPIMIPVPLGINRRKERGYNQVGEIIRRASRACGIPFDETLLIRTRETTSQISLPRRAREENMRGAFGAAHAADPSRTYIIVDDVVTTGATLQAAVDALIEAGAVDIVPIALAH